VQKAWLQQQLDFFSKKKNVVQNVVATTNPFFSSRVSSANVQSFPAFPDFNNVSFKPAWDCFLRERITPVQHGCHSAHSPIYRVYDSFSDR